MMVEQWVESLFTSVWSGLLIYGVFGIASLVLASVRFRWYRKIQQERSILIFALTNLFQGVAFVCATLLLAPHPVTDFRFLLPYVRIAWLCTLVCFLYGTHLAYWKLVKIEENRRRGILAKGE
jgi:hypothetical protein